MSDTQAEYRKYQNGKEFMKLREGVLLSVLHGPDDVRIICSSNKYLIQDFRDDRISMESNSKEFAQAMSEALFQISKIDN